MRTVQQRLIDLKTKVNLGKNICRILLLVLFISLITNAILAFQLYNISQSSQETSAPIIVGSGEMKQIGDNMFEILDEKDLDCDCTLPPLPSHLKK